MSHVFSRATRDLPTAVSAEGVWIADADGTRYLDGAGGAIVVNVGHGVPSVIDAITEQLGRTQYVHPTAFTTDAVEAYAEEVAGILPMEDARLYPVSGGSEAVETALKMARAYHLAKGQAGRSLVIGRRSSYHGNTIGAARRVGEGAAPQAVHAVAGSVPPRLRRVRAPVREPAAPARLRRVARGRAREDDRVLRGGHVAAFIAEPVAGATLGAAVPDDGYWAAIADVCRQHDVLVIADEVMTGFGRTGSWFGVEHWDVQPDLLTAGKGTTSGYVPFGFAAASGRGGRGDRVRAWVRARLHVVPQRAGRRRRSGRPPGAEGRARGSEPRARRAAPVRAGGRARGRRDGGRGPRPRADDRDRAGAGPRDAGAVRPVRPGRRAGAEAAREAELLLYSSTGHVDGANGDLVMLGPPFCLSDDEAGTLVERTVAAIRAVS